MMKLLHIMLLVVIISSCDVEEAAKEFKAKEIRDPIFPYSINPYEISDPNYL